MIEYLGNSTINNLKDILEEQHFKKIFLITGKNSFEKTTIKPTLLRILKNYELFHFNDFSPNPKLNDIIKGIELFKQEKYDAIIAIGGGSVLDMGKSISILSHNNISPIDFILKKKQLDKKGTPLIRIPTTAGSGSEATHFAVVYIDKVKHSLADSTFMQPEYVIVDPELTYTMSKPLTASSGLDAFTQAIESFWNISSTNLSKKYSKKAITLILSNIIEATHNPDKKSRYNMAIAANFAGKAINITKTTACHAISYPITSYFNVPHGHAAALTLPSILLFNSEVSDNDVIDPRGVNYVRKSMSELIRILGCSSFIEAKEKITELITKLNLHVKFKELGIKSPEDIEIIIKNGFNPERVKNNPRLLTESKLKEILSGL